MSSRMLATVKRHYQSVMHIHKHYLRARASRVGLRMSGSIAEYISQYIVFPFAVHFPLWFVVVYGNFSLPEGQFYMNSTYNAEKERSMRTYIDDCLPYSSGHVFHGLLIEHDGFISLWMLLIMGLCCSICAPPERVNPGYAYLILARILLIFDSVACISIQIRSAITCRPMEIIFDLRFLSLLVVQLIGFIGCLLFAVRLGATHAMEIRLQILPDKTIHSPCQECLLSNSK